MPITQEVFEVGGVTPLSIVPPTFDAQKAWIKNLQPIPSDDTYSRDGYVYLTERLFTVTAAGTAGFAMDTGPTGLQIEFYGVASTLHNVYATLLEGATVTVTGTAIPGYNMNRNASDAHTSRLYEAATITGGTAVSAEFINASVQGGGSQVDEDKVHTLKANTRYAFRFVNLGNQDTQVFFKLGFAEQYNGYHDVWLSTSAGDSMVLRAGEQVQLSLFPHEPISAITTGLTCRIAVMRQD